MKDQKPKLEVFAMPIKGCSYELTWQAAFDKVCHQLDKKLNGFYEARFIELFSPESFRYTEVMQLYKQGEIKDPVVLLDGEIIIHGEKLSALKIRKRIAEKLAETESH